MHKNNPTLSCWSRSTLPAIWWLFLAQGSHSAWWQCQWIPSAQEQVSCSIPAASLPRSCPWEARLQGFQLEQQQGPRSITLSAAGGLRSLSHGHHRENKRDICGSQSRGFLMLFLPAQLTQGKTGSREVSQKFLYPSVAESCWQGQLRGHVVCAVTCALHLEGAMLGWCSGGTILDLLMFLSLNLCFVSKIWWDSGAVPVPRWYPQCACPQGASWPPIYVQRP